MKLAKDIQASALSKFLPPPKITLSEWAVQNYRIAKGTGSTHGGFTFALTPHLREILDAFTDPKISRITWISSVQSAKTTALMVAASYFIVQDPSSIIISEPTDALATSVSQERFAPTIEENPQLKRILRGDTSKDNEDIKIFPGGYLLFASAGSYADLISRPARVVLMDEGDAPEYLKDLKGRGSPVKLLEDRTTTFHNKKIALMGTPGTLGGSNLYNSYEKSDMRVYQCPCPHCGHFQELVFGQLKWEKGTGGRNPWYECISCKAKLKETDKNYLVNNGKFVSTNPNPEEARHVGFRTNQMIALFPETTWESITTRFCNANKNNDKRELKTWTQQVMAECWSDRYLNDVSENELMGRCEEYPDSGEVPMDAGMLFAGIDTQGDRVEVSVLGFGKRGHIWLIDHRTILGRPDEDPDHPQAKLWQELDSYLLRPWKHESGHNLYIRSAFLDTNDNQMGRAAQGRKFCFQRTSRLIFPIIGSNDPKEPAWRGKPWTDPVTKRRAFYVGSSSLKEELFNRLQVKNPQDTGYIHFPKDHPYASVPRFGHINEEYFLQLTAEKLVEDSKGGRFWKKTRARNEALDCFNYAYACFLKEMGHRLALLDEVVDLLSIPPESNYQNGEILNEREVKPKDEEHFDFFKVRSSIY